jgi:putative membrane protein
MSRLSIAVLALLVSAAPVARAAEATAPALTDANIAAIVLAANTIDVKNAQLALGKTKNAKVKEFAQRMVTDHNSVNAKAVALAGKLGLKPEENQASRDLVKNTDATRKKIAKSSGAAFDRAYVDNEVAYHQAVLDLLDKTIVPAVQNAELKDLLVSVRPAFVAHLEHAKMVQGELAK